MSKISIRFYKNHKMRAVWDEEQNQCHRDRSMISENW